MRKPKIKKLNLFQSLFAVITSIKPSQIAIVIGAGLTAFQAIIPMLDNTDTIRLSNVMLIFATVFVSYLISKAFRLDAKQQQAVIEQSQEVIKALLTELNKAQQNQIVVVNPAKEPISLDDESGVNQ